MMHEASRIRMELQFVELKSSALIAHVRVTLGS